MDYSSWEIAINTAESLIGPSTSNSVNFSFSHRRLVSFWKHSLYSCSEIPSYGALFRRFSRWLTYGSVRVVNPLTDRVPR
jgi:hypothetical protein